MIFLKLIVERIIEIILIFGFVGVVMFCIKKVLNIKVINNSGSEIQKI